MNRTPPPTWTPWTLEEEAQLQALYPTGGIEACTKALPNRTAHAIRRRLQDLKIKLTEQKKFEIQSAARTAGHVASHPWSARTPADEIAIAWARRRAQRTA